MSETATLPEIGELTVQLGEALSGLASAKQAMLTKAIEASAAKETYQALLDATRALQTQINDAITVCLNI